MNFDEQSISDLLKRMRAARANQALPSQADLAQFQTLAGLVHVIDGLSFRQHFGEVMLYLLTQVDSVPGEGDRQEPKPSSNPAKVSAPDSPRKPQESSAPLAQSNPVRNSVVNPIFEEPNQAQIGEPTNTSKPEVISAPVSPSNPQDSSTPLGSSKPEANSNLFCVRTSTFWACDNEKCGNDDLIMEMQLPSDKRKTEQIRYQCLKCTLIGTAELTTEEITKAMKEEKRVEFSIGTTNVFDFLNQPRPAGKKRKSKQDAQPGEPKGTPLIDAIEAGEQHMRAIAQEGRAPAPASPAISATQNSGASQAPIEPQARKAKKGGTADATPFPSLGGYPTGQAPTNQPSAAPVETPAAVKKAVEKVITAQVSPSEVVSDEMMKTLTSTVSAWALERLIKEWEGMTGKVYKQGVTVPDAMVTEVVFQLAGVPMNA